MILILTPIYKNFEVAKILCKAIEKLTFNEYRHILINDDSGAEMPIEATENRQIIRVRRDVPGIPHKSGLGQMLQLVFDYANQIYCNEVENPIFTHIFVIESDVIPLAKDWDKLQISLLENIPGNWGTLDATSIDEEGKITYPCTVSPRDDSFSNALFEKLVYPDFQCMLVNQKVFNKGIHFGDAPSHFDIMFGRSMEKFGFVPYRVKDLQVLHINGGGNSRDLLK